MTGRPATDMVRLVTVDDVRLDGRRWTHPSPRASIVVVHGFAASSDETDVASLAEHLHAASCTVLAVDGRGHGTSGGVCTLGDLERHDVAAAIAEARSDTELPVIVVGASMGAIATLHHLSEQPGAVDGIVVVSCPAHWKLPRNARGILSVLMTQTRLGRWFARRHLGVRIARRMVRPAPPVELIARVGAPIAIVHGADDPFIEPSAATALHAAAPEPRRVAIVEGMGHAFPQASRAAVHDAVEWVLAVRRAPG